MEEAARALSLASAGVEALVWRSVWSIETAFRVADALDLSVVKNWEEALKSFGDNGNGRASDT